MNNVSLANPLQGTDSPREISNGKTSPLVTISWGMMHWTIQSKEEPEHGSWVYRYGDRKIESIRATHQPLTRISDYGHFTILPLTGDVSLLANSRSSSFRQKNRDVNLDHMNVILKRYSIKNEWAP